MSEKCADNIQCIDKYKICDGERDCLDGSDEMCKASCLQSPLGSASKTIVRRCIEDIETCIPLDKYCDKMADCSYGSDEADCSCADLDMHDCKVHGARLCMFKEWATDDRMYISVCQNEMKQEDRTNGATVIHSISKTEFFMLDPCLGTLKCVA